MINQSIRMISSGINTVSSLFVPVAVEMGLKDPRMGKIVSGAMMTYHGIGLTLKSRVNPFSLQNSRRALVKAAIGISTGVLGIELMASGIQQLISEPTPPLYFHEIDCGSTPLELFRKSVTKQLSKRLSDC